MAATKKNPAKDVPTQVPPVVDEDFNQVRLAVEQMDLPDLAADETGYLVEGKYYAAVRFARGDGTSKHMFGLSAFAFARDQAGKPYLTAMGLPIEGAFSASCEKKELLANTKKTEEVRAAALDGALRDMLAHIAENVAFEKLKI
jgi:hypothetical protein